MKLPVLESLFKKVAGLSNIVKKAGSNHWKSSVKKEMFLKMSQISQEIPVLESLFNKVAGVKADKFIKKRLQHRRFCVKSSTFLGTPILKNICERMELVWRACFS